MAKIAVAVEQIVAEIVEVPNDEVSNVSEQIQADMAGLGINTELEGADVIITNIS